MCKRNLLKGYQSPINGPLSGHFDVISRFNDILHIPFILQIQWLCIYSRVAKVT